MYMVELFLWGILLDVAELVYWLLYLGYVVQDWILHYY